jgi:hypothetical protein
MLRRDTKWTLTAVGQIITISSGERAHIFRRVLSPQKDQ